MWVGLSCSCNSYILHTHGNNRMVGGAHYVATGIRILREACQGISTHVRANRVVDLATGWGSPLARLFVKHVILVSRHCEVVERRLQDNNYYA